MAAITDALGQRIALASAPERIVSLVPSVTESVIALGKASQLVGVTKFCQYPADATAPLRKVGGTKDPDLAAIAALHPDLVLANQEENRREDVEALRQAGLTVYVAYPRTVAQALEELQRLADLLRAPVVTTLLARLRPILEEQERWNVRRPRVRVFCPIWRHPYMAVGGDTFAGDVLRRAGGDNVFETHPSGHRYPQVTLAEIEAAEPDVVLLPDEPYLFRESHRQEFLALRRLPAARAERIVLLSGQWLTWHGPRLAEGVRGVAAVLDQARPHWQPPLATTPTAPASSRPRRDRPSASRTAGQEPPLPPGLRLPPAPPDVVDPRPRAWVRDDSQRG